MPDTKAIYTIGYEKRDLSEMIATLAENGVDVLVDVRELPLSRRKGFSKTPLRTALEEAGLGYVHLKELGNPKAIRKSEGTPEEIVSRYAEHMEDLWPEALSRLLDLAQESTVCLMCYERQPCECHRTVVAHAAGDALGAQLVEL